VRSQKIKKKSSKVSKFAREKMRESTYFLLGYNRQARQALIKI
jgi:hypothetical protein